MILKISLYRICDFPSASFILNFESSHRICDFPIASNILFLRTADGFEYPVPSNTLSSGIPILLGGLLLWIDFISIFLVVRLSDFFGQTFALIILSSRTALSFDYPKWNSQPVPKSEPLSVKLFVQYSEYGSLSELNVRELYIRVGVYWCWLIYPIQRLLSQPQSSSCYLT